MSRYDHALRVDNSLFLIAIVVGAAFAMDRFVDQEREKTAIAQARELRNWGLARAAEACAPNGPLTRRSDANDPCGKPMERHK